MKSESALLGVRFIASPETLSKVEQAVMGAGWTEIRHEQGDTILVLAPKPYHFDQFAKLIDAVDAISPRDFALQLIGPDGKPVNVGPPENNR